MTRVDGRRARGDVTRRLAATAAAEMATLEGLDSISMSRLAKATGCSASGILTVFESREAVQLAAVARARELVVENVIAPAWSAEPGTARLGRIVDNWFSYVERKVFPGGCFLVATAVEYGAQTGPVADAVRGLRAEWIGMLEGELRVGRRRSRKQDELVRETAFRLDAYLAAANTRHRLTGDPAELELAQRLCRRLLREHA